jgi:hypothetical protein
MGLLPHDFADSKAYILCKHEIMPDKHATYDHGIIFIIIVALFYCNGNKRYENNKAKNIKLLASKNNDYQ